MCTSIFSASLLLVEEEQENALVTAAAGAVSGLVVEHWSKMGQRNDADEHSTERRAIAWNRECAAMCIGEEYLGAIPTFLMDDFKRISQVPFVC